MEISMKRVAWLVLGVSLIVAFAYGVVRYKNENIIDKGKREVVKAKTGSSIYSVQMSERQIMEALERGGRRRFSGTAEAISANEWMKFPKNGLGKAITRIFEIEPQVGVGIFYEKGLLVTGEKREKPSNESARELIEYFRKEREEAKKRGEVNSDAVQVLVEINGIEGIGIEPGYNIINGNKEPRPGVVSWEEKGVKYHIYGEEISLDQLLEVARSMK